PAAELHPKHLLGGRSLVGRVRAVPGRYERKIPPATAGPAEARQDRQQLQQRRPAVNLAASPKRAFGPVLRFPEFEAGSAVRRPALRSRVTWQSSFARAASFRLEGGGGAAARGRCGVAARAGQSASGCSG